MNGMEFKSQKVMDSVHPESQFLGRHVPPQYAEQQAGAPLPLGTGVTALNTETRGHLRSPRSDIISHQRLCEPKAPFRDDVINSRPEVGDLLPPGRANTDGGFAGFWKNVKKETGGSPCPFICSHKHHCPLNTNQAGHSAQQLGQHLRPKSLLL